MSTYSGYSSASRLEIARIEQEKSVMASQMAAQNAQLASQKAQMESLQALHMANGLVSTPTTGDVLAGIISNSLHDRPGTPVHQVMHGLKVRLG